MAGLATRRYTCRLCDGKALSKVFSLAPTPLANAFVRREDIDKPQRLYPLDLYFCEQCGHLQLLDVVDPVELYEHYVYVSGTSPVFVKHFSQYADYVIDQFDPPEDGLVVDIGANDGTLLGFFKRRGRRVVGVDPAIEISAQATAAGIPILNEFFTPTLAERIRDEHGSASVITANNVIAHIDDLSGVMLGVRRLLAPTGIFVFEVSYLVDVIEKTLFDTIYHEHLDYHAVGPLVQFFDRCGLQLVEANCVDSHGGSLRGVAQLKGGPRPVGKSVPAATEIEMRMGLGRSEAYRDFAAHVDALKTRLVDLLHALKTQGKRIAGFGAPAKATTLLYHFEIERGVLEFIIDDSPMKQGLYSPGSHIPVVPSQELYRRRPDYVVILAWNFADSIIEKHRAFLDAGGRFIVPLPDLRVI